MHTNLSVEFVVAEIQGSIDRLEGLKVNVDLLFLALRGHNGTTINHKTVVRHSCVQFESLLG